MNRGATGWLGFLFFIALILVLWATLIVGEFRFREPFPIKIHFRSVPGLRKGDDVRVDGMLFGKVKEIRLDPRGGVLVDAELDRKIDLFQDGKIYIEASSVLGGTRIAISRGSERPARDLDQTLPGEVRPGIEAVPQAVEKIEPQLTETIKEIRNLVKGINEGRGTLGQLLTNPKLHDELTATVQETRQAIGDARGTIAEAKGALGKIREAGETVQKAVVKLDKGEGPLPALLNDRKMTDKLNAALDTVQETADNLKAATEKINKGEGTLGRLLNDAEMGDSLKKAVQNIEKSSKSIEAITERIEKGPGTINKLIQDPELYDRTKQTVEDLDKVVGKAARAVVEIVGDSKYYLDSESSISKLGMKIRLSDSREFHGALLEDKYFYVGASFMSFSREGDILYKELFEEGEDAIYVKADVQLAYRIPWLFNRRVAVHGGLLEGKPGGGVDVLWDNWLVAHWPVNFSFEIRGAYDDLENDDIDEDIDGPMMRAFAKIPIWTRREGWLDTLLSTVRVYGGVSRIGNDPDYMVGIGLEWPDDDIRSLVSLIGLAR